MKKRKSPHAKRQHKNKIQFGGFITAEKAAKAGESVQRQKERAKYLLALRKFRFGKKDSGKFVLISPSGKRVTDLRKEKGYLVYKSAGSRVYIVRGIYGTSYRPKLFTSYNIAGFFAKKASRKFLKKRASKRGEVEKIGSEYVVKPTIIKAGKGNTAWENFREWLYKFWKSQKENHYIVRTTWKIKRGKSTRLIRSDMNLPMPELEKTQLYKHLWLIYWHAMEQEDQTSFDKKEWVTSGSNKEIGELSKNKGRKRSEWKVKKPFWGRWGHEGTGEWSRRFYEIVTVKSIEVSLEALT